MMHESAEVTRTIVGSLLAALILTAGQAAAQSPQPAPSPSPGASTPTTRLGTVEGTVRKVDSMGGMVEVSSGLFGLFGTTLQVKPDTRIQAEGRQTSLADIRAGDKVKASYEIREGETIARSIQVTPAPEAPKASTPRSPGSGAQPPPSQ
jgi:hypothetical protein